MLIIAIGIGARARANCSVYLLPIVYLTVNQTTIGKWNCIISREQVLVMITTTPLHISSLLTVAAVVMFRQDDPGKQSLREEKVRIMKI